MDSTPAIVAIETQNTETVDIVKLDTESKNAKMKQEFLDLIKDNDNLSTEIFKYILLFEENSNEEVTLKQIGDEIANDARVSIDMIVSLTTNIIALLIEWILVASNGVSSCSIIEKMKKISDEDGLFKPLFITVEEKSKDINTDIGSILNQICSNIHNWNICRKIQECDDVNTHRFDDGATIQVDVTTSTDGVDVNGESEESDGFVDRYTIYVNKTIC